jgi:hypothetical protein
VSTLFENIYNDLSWDNLKEQNPASLKLIRQSLTDLAKSGILGAESKEELVGMLVDLTQHIQWDA